MCRTDLVAGNDARKFTVSGPFFFDLLPETTNLFERGAIVDRVYQEERVSRRDGQAPHRRELEVASGYRPWSNCPSCDGGQSGQLRLRDEFLCGTQEVLWVGVYQLRVVNGQSLSWNYSWFQSSPFRGQHVLGR